MDEKTQRLNRHALTLFYGLLNQEERETITTPKQLFDYQRHLSELYCCSFGLFSDIEIYGEISLDQMPQLSFDEAVKQHELFCNQEFVDGQYVKFKSPTGVFYTPKVGVEHVVTSLREKIEKSKRIIDPTMGCGRFVIGIFKMLCETCDPIDVLNRLYGVDIDPVAVSLVRMWFCRTLGVQVALEVSKRFLCGNGLTGILRFKTFQKRYPKDYQNYLAGNPVKTKMPLDAICWFSDFQEVALQKGFDLVIGNPPWHILTKQDTKHIGWDEFKINKKKGKKDFWKLFVERSTQMVVKRGVVAFLVPWGFTSLQSCSALRDYLTETGNIFLLDQFGISQVFPDIQKGTVFFAWERGVSQEKVSWLKDGRIEQGAVTTSSRVIVSIGRIFPLKSTGLTIRDVFDLRRGIQDTKKAICLPWDNSTPIANSHFDDPNKVRERFAVEPVAFHCTQAVTPFLIRRSFCQRSKKRWQYSKRSPRAGEFKLRWCPPNILPNPEMYETVVVKSLMGPLTKKRLVAAPCESNEFGSESVIFIRIPKGNYCKWFVLGLLNSDYLERFIRRDNPTTTNLRIGRIPFRHIEPSKKLYKEIATCAKKIHKLQKANQQQIDQDEREILGVEDLEEVLPADRLERFGDIQSLNQELLERLNLAVEKYYKA